MQFGRIATPFVLTIILLTRTHRLNADDSTAAAASDGNSTATTKAIPPQPSKTASDAHPVPVKSQPPVVRSQVVNGAEAAAAAENPIVDSRASGSAASGAGTAAAMPSPLSNAGAVPLDARGMMSAQRSLTRTMDAGIYNRRSALLRQSTALRRAQSGYVPRSNGSRSHPLNLGAYAQGPLQRNKKLIAPASELVSSFSLYQPDPNAPAVDFNSGSSAAEPSGMEPAASANPAVTASGALNNAAAGSTPSATASKESPGVSVAAPGPAVVAVRRGPTPPIDQWERYFLDVSKYYQFTTSQHEAGRRILEHLRFRARQYTMSRERELDAARKLTDRDRQATRIAELNGPIDQMFDELKARLENLPTLQQKHQADGPAPK